MQAIIFFYILVVFVIYKNIQIDFLKKHQFWFHLIKFLSLMILWFLLVILNQVMNGQFYNNPLEKIYWIGICSVFIYTSLEIGVSLIRVKRKTTHAIEDGLLYCAYVGFSFVGILSIIRLFQFSQTSHVMAGDIFTPLNAFLLVVFPMIKIDSILWVKRSKREWIYFGLKIIERLFIFFMLVSANMYFIVIPLAVRCIVVLYQKRLSKKLFDYIYSVVFGLVGLAYVVMFMLNGNYQMFIEALGR